MATIRYPNCIVTIPDDYGRAFVRGSWWSWDYRDAGFMACFSFQRDGEDVDDPGINHPAWKAFGRFVNRFDREPGRRDWRKLSPAAKRRAAYHDARRATRKAGAPGTLPAPRPCASRTTPGTPRWPVP